MLFLLEKKFKMLTDWTGPLEGLHRHAAVVPISAMGVVIYYLLYPMRMFSIIIIILPAAGRCLQAGKGQGLGDWLGISEGALRLAHTFQGGS
jgi:hypothetical protein